MGENEYDKQMHVTLRPHWYTEARAQDSHLLE